ncbi:MAG: hypothetical protein WA865_00130 [Spirulinaceae cyanobacterium]
MNLYQGEFDWLYTWFNKALVEEAHAEKTKLCQWMWKHPKEIAIAFQKLKEVRAEPEKATEYVNNLEPNLKKSLVLAIIAS